MRSAPESSHRSPYATSSPASDPSQELCGRFTSGWVRSARRSSGRSQSGRADGEGHPATLPTAVPPLQRNFLLPGDGDALPVITGQ